MNDKVKVIVAVVLLAVACLVVAWQMGVFSSGPEGRANSDRPTAELNNDGQLESFEADDGTPTSSASPRTLPSN